MFQLSIVLKDHYLEEVNDFSIVAVVVAGAVDGNGHRLMMLKLEFFFVIIFQY